MCETLVYSRGCLTSRSKEGLRNFNGTHCTRLRRRVSFKRGWAELSALNQQPESAQGVFGEEFSSDDDVYYPDSDSESGEEFEHPITHYHYPNRIGRFHERDEAIERGFPTSYPLNCHVILSAFPLRPNYATPVPDAPKLPDWADPSIAESMLGAGWVSSLAGEFFEPSRQHAPLYITYDFRQVGSELRAKPRPGGPPKPGKPTCLREEFEKAEEAQQEEISEASLALELAVPGTFQSIDALWYPPRGGAVEKDRQCFYYARAAKTRFDSSSRKEKMPTQHQYNLYEKALDAIFHRQGVPQLPNIQHIFDKVNITQGNKPYYVLRRSVFERVLSECKPNGMPGYPFVYLESRVCDLHPDQLYNTLNDLLNKWIEYDFTEALALPEPARTLTMFRDGVLFPATAFVKSEPTKMDKIARNIFGVSVIMNMVSRILFGDFIARLTSSWGEVEHKIGIDFYTREGLERITNFHVKLFQNAANWNRDIVSDDVQGWEYMDREWMHDLWHNMYLKHACELVVDPDNGSRWIVGDHDPRVAKLYHAFRICDKLAPIMFSDGTFTVKPFYICLSGRYLTHAQNSNSRAALGMMAAVGEVDFSDHLFADVICETNGDDFVGFEGDPDVYGSLGFVLTDRVKQTIDNVNFCSQRFVRDATGRTLRMPDGLAKLFVNAVHAQERSDYYDCIMNMVSHPAFEQFKRAVDAFRKARQDRSNQRLEEELMGGPLLEFSPV